MAICDNCEADNQIDIGLYMEKIQGQIICESCLYEANQCKDCHKYEFLNPETEEVQNPNYRCDSCREQRQLERRYAYDNDFDAAEVEPVLTMRDYQ